MVVLLWSPSAGPHNQSLLGSSRSSIHPQGPHLNAPQNLPLPPPPAGPATTPRRSEALFLIPSPSCSQTHMADVRRCHTWSSATDSCTTDSMVRLLWGSPRSSLMVLTLSLGRSWDPPSADLRLGPRDQRPHCSETPPTPGKACGHHIR